MTRHRLHVLAGVLMSLAAASSATTAMAETLEVFHADSLAGPMGALKRAFEAHHPEISIHLTSGVSKQLAERILNGETCDVYASSSPSVIEQDLMKGSVKGAAQRAASWYAVFSANEMVLIVRTGNPLGIRRISDLAKPGIRFVRVTGEKDLATARTVEFVKRATALEGNPDLARNIISSAPDDPSQPVSVPAIVRAVLDGRVDAGIVYYSAAVAAGPDISIIRYPAPVNMSEEIRNAISVPATARNPIAAEAFARFLLEPEGRKILEATGQPPVIPAVRVGATPDSLRD
jgi:molybdate transport system substrate-binding protein